MRARHLFAVAGAPAAAGGAEEVVAVLDSGESRGGDQPHDLDLESELFVGLTGSGVFRCLTGLDPTAREQVVAKTAAQALDQGDRVAVEQQDRRPHQLLSASYTARCACARNRPHASQFGIPGAPSAGMWSSRSAMRGSASIAASTYDSICSCSSSGVPGSPVASSRRNAKVANTDDPPAPSVYVSAARNRRGSGSSPLSSFVSRMSASRIGSSRSTPPPRRRNAPRG